MAEKTKIGAETEELITIKNPLPHHKHNGIFVPMGAEIKVTKDQAAFIERVAAEIKGGGSK